MSQPPPARHLITTFPFTFVPQLLGLLPYIILETADSFEFRQERTYTFYVREKKAQQPPFFSLSQSKHFSCMPLLIGQAYFIMAAQVHLAYEIYTATLHEQVESAWKPTTGKRVLILHNAGARGPGGEPAAGS